MQDAVKALPVIVQSCRIGSSPDVQFFDQRKALRLVLSRFGLNLVQPGGDYFVGFIAGLVKTLPQGVVGHSALVCLLPLVAQGTQRLLHLASADGLALGPLEQAFGLGDELFAQLVCAPSLPAFQFTGSTQGRMGAVLQFVINEAAKFFQGTAKRGCRASTGFAVAFGNLGFQRGQHFLHSGIGFGSHFGVQLGLGSLGRSFNRNTTGYAHLVGPHRHRRQRRRSILRGGNGLAQSSLKRVPHDQQLSARGIQ